ncbi:hypothetical protein MHYP_G00220780 [Metynnis hypsauchen]
MRKWTKTAGRLNRVCPSGSYDSDTFAFSSYFTSVPLLSCLHQGKEARAFVSELRGKKVEDVIAQGYGKLASMPAGGAVAVATSAAPAAGGAAAPAAAAEEKKEEKKEESEESDDDMGFGLFD